MPNLNAAQLERQDLVDSLILQLIEDLTPYENLIQHDAEMIGEVRDVIGHWLVERLEIMSAQEFYPTLQEESNA